MPLAIDAIGEGWLGPNRAAIAAFTLGLLLTFLFVRLNTRLIRANVSWWFHDIESEGGLHVHHMVIGVVVMVAAGLGLIAVQPRGPVDAAPRRRCSASASALTLDEFALILRLQDVYWTTEGRLSVDAVIVAVCVGLLLVLGYAPLGNAATVGLRHRRRRGRSSCVIVDRRRARRDLPAQGQALDRVLRRLHPDSSAGSARSASRGPARRGPTGATPTSRRSWPRRSAGRST